MISLSLFIMAVSIISTLVMFLSSMLAKKTIKDREKSSPFECGFDPKSSARLPFSLRFFLIAVIFLIFDVEIALILPLANTYLSSNFKTWFITGVIFLFILLLGLYHEWNQGALDWAEWSYNQRYDT